MPSKEASSAPEVQQTNPGVRVWRLADGSQMLEIPDPPETYQDEHGRELPEPHFDPNFKQKKVPGDAVLVGTPPAP